jgi:hypothetical protein
MFIDLLKGYEDYKAKKPGLGVANRSRVGSTKLLHYLWRSWRWWWWWWWW